MKHHVQGVLANLSAMMPCFTLGGYKLPKVTGKKGRAADSPSRVSALPHALCIVTIWGGICNPPNSTEWVGAGIDVLPQL